MITFYQVYRGALAPGYYGGTQRRLVFEHRDFEIEVDVVQYIDYHGNYESFIEPVRSLFYGPEIYAFAQLMKVVYGFLLVSEGHWLLRRR